MASGLSTTSFALLGLLAFDSETSTHGMTGYELKGRADRTLRFYWSSPAMSQIYTELGRLRKDGLVTPLDDKSGRRTTRRYRITDDGRAALTTWLHTSEVEFPVLKHPVALRMLMGHLLEPDRVRSLLDDYRGAVAERRAELQDVRDFLADREDVKFAALVADWGLHYYDSEDDIVAKLTRRLDG